jgi:hypothetical protein
MGFIQPEPIGGKTKLYTSVLLPGAIVAILMAFVLCVARIIFPYDVGFYDGGIWAPSQLIMHGMNCYSMNWADHSPYIMSPYGIVYYGIVALGIKLFGLQFWFARVLSLLSLLVCVYCIYTLLMRFTRKRENALLGVILFLFQPPVQICSAVQHPDMLALAFSLAGIAFAIKDKETKRTLKSNILSAIALSAAILTRQTSVLPVAFVLIWFLMEKDRVSFFQTGISVVLLLFILMTVLQMTSHGGYLWQQFILASSVEKSWVIAFQNLYEYAFSIASIGAFGLLYLGVIVERYSKDDVSNVKSMQMRFYLFRKVTLLYTVCSILLAAVTASRAGSSINYYLEVSAVISLLIPMYWMEIAERFKQQWKVKAIFVVILFGGLITAAKQYRSIYYFNAAKPYYQEIIQKIRQSTNPNEPIFTVYPDLVVAANRKYEINDFCQYDGRVPKLKTMQDSLFSMHVFSAVLKHTQTPIPGYTIVKTTTPEPKKVFQLYLFLRDSHVDDR